MARLQDAVIKIDVTGLREAAAELRDAASPLQAAGDVERRFLRCEVRAVDGEDGERRIEGYAAVFEQESEDLGGWREVIMPGAFADAVSDDVRALFNHDPSLILGRTVSGTLDLAEDERGLRYAIQPPDTRYAQDLLVSLERGDVDQSSFGFRVIEDRWIQPTDERPYPVRVLHKVTLFDVSPVTFPAYPTTTVAVRSMVESFSPDPSPQPSGEETPLGPQGGEGVEEEEHSLDGGATGGETEDGDRRAGGRLALMHMKLDLAELE